jgi:hypothetical protein
LAIWHAMVISMYGRVSCTMIAGLTLAGGGMRTSTNRTKWPLTGGAVAFQPGWFQGHSSAFIYINMGFGTIPPNMSNIILNGIEIIGPTNEPYPGTWCFPQLPLPANATVKVGDNATIQLIEAAKHGAALFNCVDITFAEPGDPDIPEVNATNCFNSSQLRYDLLFTTSSLKEDTGDGVRLGYRFGWITTLLALAIGCLFV